MLSASIVVARYPSTDVRDCGNAGLQLEQSFARYEAGRTSIVGYPEAVNELAQNVRRRRALALCQQGGDVTSCLAVAGANSLHTPGEPRGTAA